jgi:hypothetical protein
VVFRDFRYWYYQTQSIKYLYLTCLNKGRTENMSKGKRPQEMTRLIYKKQKEKDNS